MKAGRARVKKMITDYEKTHLKGGGVNSMTIPKEYILENHGTVYRTVYEPVTKVSAKRQRETTFSTGSSRQGGEKSPKCSDVEDSDSTGLEVTLNPLIPVVVLLMSLVVYVVNAARTIINTYNVLPVTFNMAPSGLITWIVFIWLIKRFRDFFDQTFAFDVTVADKGTQTEEFLKHPVQADGSPILCTENSTSEHSSLAFHKETQV